MRKGKRVGLAHDVEHDIIIVRVAVVAVVKPIGGAVVNLYVAGPIGGADLDFRIEEVGPIMGVGEPHVDDLNALAALRRQRTQGKEAMAPYVVKQLLHKGVHIWLICQRYGFWAGRTRSWLHFLASSALKRAHESRGSRPAELSQRAAGAFDAITRWNFCG